MRKDIETYSRIMRVRGLFQRIQQVSWQSSQIAKNYPIDDLTAAEQRDLLEAYFAMLPEVVQITNELESEYEQRRTAN